MLRQKKSYTITIIDGILRRFKVPKDDECARGSDLHVEPLFS